MDAVGRSSGLNGWGVGLTDALSFLATLMELYLKTDVHVAVIEDDAVFLDVARDAYLCVPGGGPAFTGADSQLRLRPGPLALKLQAAGMADEGPAKARRALPEHPRRSIIHDVRAEPLRLPDLWRLAGALRDLRKVQQSPGLAPYLDLADDDPSLSGDPERLQSAARLFHDLVVWAPFDGECLQRSALLMAWLHRRGLRADWVFGVRLWPFSAHCWVQCDDVCLNDDFERLQAFTPILCR